MKQRNRKYLKTYQQNEEPKHIFGTADDPTFIKNLFLMSRNKRYEYKMLIRTMIAMNQHRMAQFVKSYGISGDLISRMSEILVLPESSDSIIQKFTDFVVAEYEKYKEAGTINQENNN